MEGTISTRRDRKFQFGNEAAAEAGEARERSATSRERSAADHAAQYLAAIVESSDDAIISKNLDGIILTWNKGAERIFGYKAEEVIGKPVTILMPPERVNEEPGILARIRRGERVDHYETVRRRKDGTRIDISLTVSPMKDQSGRIIGASGFFTLSNIMFATAITCSPSAACSATVRVECDRRRPATFGPNRAGTTHNSPLSPRSRRSPILQCPHENVTVLRRSGPRLRALDTPRTPLTGPACRGVDSLTPQP